MGKAVRSVPAIPLPEVTKQMTFYQDKNCDYYAKARIGILPLLPAHADRILEIGCAEGATLRWVRDRLKSSWIGGVELFEDAAGKARTRIDWVAQGDIEKMDLPFEEASMDLILCLDVLEHLWDPWSVVTRLSGLLKPGGALVISIPNVLHHSVMVPLILRGRFDYRDEGVLDKTHIRFFTKATAVELAESGGLSVDMVTNSGIVKGSRSALANMATLGLLQPLFETQYLIRALKPA